LLDPYGKKYDYNNVNVFFERDDGTFYASTSWASVLVCRRIDNNYYAHSLLYTGGSRCFYVLTGTDKDRKCVAREADGQQQIVTKLGGNDNDLTSVWKYHDFEDKEFPLFIATTAGISSCAGGLTFCNTEYPEWIILWHTDAPVSVPVKFVIERIWPEEDYPELRTISMVHPDPWELSKYREENLYPASIQNSCETIFMPRGAHLHKEYVISNCGQDLFGLQFASNAEANFVGTYDISQRTIIMRGRRMMNPGNPELSETTLDLNDEIFGTHRYLDQEVKSVDEMRDYLKVTQTKKFKLDLLKKSSVFVLPKLGTDLFDKIDDLSESVLDTKCRFVGHVGEQVFAGATSKQWSHSEND